MGCIWTGIPTGESHRAGHIAVVTTACLFHYRLFSQCCSVILMHSSQSSTHMMLRNSVLALSFYWFLKSFHNMKNTYAEHSEFGWIQPPHTHNMFHLRLSKILPSLLSRSSGSLGQNHVPYHSSNSSEALDYTLHSSSDPHSSQSLTHYS